MNAPALPPLAVLALYCGLILVASLAGGWIPLLVRLTHTRLQIATSLVAGLMLGVGLLHMLPHAWHQLRSIDRAVAWMLGGFVVMFFIQRFFHFHHHDVAEETEKCAAGCQCHEEHASSPADHHQVVALADHSAGRLSWTGALLGLTLHTLIDGVALAASMQAEMGADWHGGWLGFGTFLVILLHKPFDAMAIGALMARDRHSRVSRHVVNAIFGLMIPAGALLYHAGAIRFTGDTQQFLGAALAFASGTFLCIAASDLLPELQFHAHDRWKLSFALLAGLAASAIIGRFEHTGHDRHDTSTRQPAHAENEPPLPAR